jgi:hypothetical protein
MKQQTPSLLRKISPIFLFAGMIFLAIGFITNNHIFTLISIAFLIVSLITGGRWLRKKKRL